MQIPLRLAIAFLVSLLGPSVDAQQVDPDLESLRGFRIGTACAELSASYDALAAEAGKLVTGTGRKCNTQVHDYYGEIFEIKGPDRKEVLILEFTPEGRLWSVISTVQWQSLAGPRSDLAIEALSKRFGRPPMYEDFRADPVIAKRKRDSENTKTQYSAAWASGGAPWRASVNTAIRMKECSKATSQVAYVECGTSQVTAMIRSWDSRLAKLAGVVTTANLEFDRGEAVELRTRMYVPSIKPLEEQARMTRSSPFEEADRRKSSNAIPKL